MIDRATWSQFYYWCGTEIWLIYCSSTNHCFTIYIYCFIPCLTRRKWGLWKYWSLQSIQWYLYTNRVLATFFPCCNLSSRAVEDEPDEDIWKKKQQSTDNKLRQYQQTGTSSLRPLLRMLAWRDERLSKVPVEERFWLVFRKQWISPEVA